MSFLVNPVSEHELRHQRYLDDFKMSVRQSRPVEGREEYMPSLPAKFDLESLNKERQLLGQRQEQLREGVREPGRLDMALGSKSMKKPVQENVEVYFPFGKPGGGAPLQKYSSLPFRQVEPSPQRILRKTPVSYEEIPKQNQNYEAQKRLEKEQQQKQYRDTLNEQLQAKKRKEANEKQMRLQEEKLEEERIRRQLDEIDAENRHDKQKSTRPPAFEDVRPQVEAPRNKQGQASAAKRQEEPQSYNSVPKPKHEKFRLTNDTSVQQAALQSLMMKMREGAETAKRENIQSIREFDQIRLDMKMKGDSYKAYESPMAVASTKQLEPLRKWKLTESKFIPLRQAGATVVKPAAFSTEEDEYFNLSNKLAKEQLVRLDKMLKYQLRTEQPQAWVDDQTDSRVPEDLGDITSYLAEE